MRRPKRVDHTRQWKIALSLAITGALAAPFVFRTYKARPTYSVWSPLTAREKENLAVSLRNSNYCREFDDSIDTDFFSISQAITCHHERENFLDG
jgi:hypothetical protein